MSVAFAFRVQRWTLVGGILTPITPPFDCRSVTMLNGTSGDVRIHTNTDESEYLVLAAGWERPLTLPEVRFSSQMIAFWLKSVLGGSMVLLWF